MPTTETTSKKTTFFDPQLVFDEDAGLVSVGLKRNYLIETETAGTVERETGDQWLVYDNKKFGWKDEGANPAPQYVITVPQDVWRAVRNFLVNLKMKGV